MIFNVKITSVGVVCNNREEFANWVVAQGRNTHVKYFPIIKASDVDTKYDEIVITPFASANPNYVDIYIKLNGAYAKARKSNRGFI